ncbi:PadR family transcriptional regulator [Actinocatenispora rupis]|uniref:Transcriptional regulator n=1 Tax=Actinocatenispora rupis TaxID=519421 RepID=A0A8J3JB59_9ACTN|nr:PadR family transcriptional regulator [Actinocatenispora rupis]GID11538.1 transcriptional regulator [Actinocatenispora rupis]
MEMLPRIGRATVDVLTVLLDSPEPRWGLELITMTGRPSGTVYPLLDRLEKAGWVESRWDDDAERRGPRRRCYTLTPDGAEAARDVVRQARSRHVRRSFGPARGAEATG